MTTLLYALTALLPLVAIGAFIQVWYCRRQRAYMPTSEWLEGMRELEAEQPSKPPVLRYKGAAGVSFTERPVKAKKLALVKSMRKEGIGK
jgi:hypothetical protein